MTNTFHDINLVYLLTRAYKLTQYARHLIFLIRCVRNHARDLRVNPFTSPNKRHLLSTTTKVRIAMHQSPTTMVPVNTFTWWGPSVYWLKHLNPHLSDSIVRTIISTRIRRIVSKFEDALSGEGQLHVAQKLHLKIDELVCTTSGPSSEESPLCTQGSLKTRMVGIKKGILDPVHVNWLGFLNGGCKWEGKALNQPQSPEPSTQAINETTSTLPVMDDLLPQLTKKC